MQARKVLNRTVITTANANAAAADRILSVSTIVIHSPLTWPRSSSASFTP